MNTTTIQKWGNSYAVRLPKLTVKKLKMKAGQSVVVQEDGTSFFITPVMQKDTDLADLIARITPHNRHNELVSGDSLGNEVW